eukprot:350975-Chlamydomonas_euryale.AAC.4
MDELGVNFWADPNDPNGPTHPLALKRTFGQPESAVRIKLYRDHAAWCPYCQKVCRVSCLLRGAGTCPCDTVLMIKHEARLHQRGKATPSSCYERLRASHADPDPASVPHPQPPHLHTWTPVGLAAAGGEAHPLRY